MKVKTSDVIWEMISNHVDTVYFVPGGGAMHLVDSLGKSGVRYCSMLSEQGASYAALGYAMTRGFGVCLVTSGPGATNAYSGCAAAWTDSIPVLFLSGQAKRSSLIGDSGLRTRGVQEIDIVTGVWHITKMAHEAENGMDAINTLERMLSLAKFNRPGPVWLSIPVDVSAERVEMP